MKEKKGNEESKSFPEGFLAAYHHVAEKSSGTLALAVIQCVVMAACALKAEKIDGIRGVILWGIAAISFLSFFFGACAVTGVILKQNLCSRFGKLALIVIFLPVYTGVMLTALLTVKSL